MRKFATPLLLFAALGVVLYFGLSQDPRAIPSPLIGKPLPHFSLTTLSDPSRKIASEDLRGRVYLLNVWASWCVACRDEHELLTNMARQKTVPIIGLNYKDKREDALRWLADMGDPYELSVVDPDGRIGIELGVYGVPETFLVDGGGMIRYKQIGPITPEVLKKTLLVKIEELRSSNTGQAHQQ